MKIIKAKNGKSYTKKQICEAIEYWERQLNENSQIDDDLTYLSIAETRIGEHFLKFAEAIKKYNIIDWKLPLRQDTKVSTKEHAFGIAISLVAIGFFYINSNMKSLYQEIVNYIKDHDYKTAQLYEYIMTHIDYHDDEKFEPKEDPEVYESKMKVNKNKKENKMKTIKAKNGKSYTKKQICEAIEYWKKQLKRLDEDISSNNVKSIINKIMSNIIYDKEESIFTIVPNNISEIKAIIHEFGIEPRFNIDSNSITDEYETINPQDAINHFISIIYKQGKTTFGNINSFGFYCPIMISELHSILDKTIYNKILKYIINDPEYIEYGEEYTIYFYVDCKNVIDDELLKKSKNISVTIA